MCGKCLYRKNCQFLATHKKVDVEGCTAFESEDEFKARIKLTAYKEFAERLKEDLYYCETIVGENGKFGYPSEDINECIDNTAKEMECEL